MAVIRLLTVSLPRLGAQHRHKMAGPLNPEHHLGFRVVPSAFPHNLVLRFRHRVSKNRASSMCLPQPPRLRLRESRHIHFFGNASRYVSHIGPNVQAVALFVQSSRCCSSASLPALYLPPMGSAANPQPDSLFRQRLLFTAAPRSAPGSIPHGCESYTRQIISSILYFRYLLFL